MAFEDKNRRKRGPGKFGPSNDDLLKRQGIGIAMYGTSEDYRDVEGEEVISEIDDNLFDSGTFGEGWEERDAPTTTPAWPRARKIGYHRKTNSLVIEFRPPGSRKTGMTGHAPWVVYYDVDLEMWEELTTYHSTGEWLKLSGVEAGVYEKLQLPQKDLLMKKIKKYHGIQDDPSS